MDDVSAIPGRGFAVDMEEHAPYMRSMSAAILNGGAGVGAVSVSAPAVRAGEDRLQRLGRRVAAAAERMTRLLLRGRRRLCRRITPPIGDPVRRIWPGSGNPVPVYSIFHACK